MPFRAKWFSRLSRLMNFRFCVRTSQLVRAKAGLGELFINCVRVVHVDRHVATKYSRELVVARACWETSKPRTAAPRRIYNAIASSADWVMTSRHKFRRGRRHLTVSFTFACIFFVSNVRNFSIVLDT